MAYETSKISTTERIALRIRDAAIVSGLSRSTLYELLKAGKLRAVKIGGRRLILRESLQGGVGAREGDPDERTIQQVVAYLHKKTS